MNENTNDKASVYQDPDHLAPANDQRQEFRLTGRIRVDVEIEAAEGQTPARLVHCSSSDISANGLRVNCADPLPEGAILPLFIQLEGKRFQLMGEVKWCFPADAQPQPGYVAGFALYESDQTSILEWKEALVHLLAE